MIQNYKSIIFDCDGVILNSNSIKKEAYYKVTASYFGNNSAELLIDYLEKNTGKPREHFFEYLLKTILNNENKGHRVSELVSEVGEQIIKGLMHCEISQSLFRLRNKTANMNWFVVSGGVEAELKEVFFKRSIFDLFDSGIFGGPNTKNEILDSLINNNKIEFPALFLGDSKYDYEAAKRVGIDFLFVSNWTNFKDWYKYCKTNELTSIGSISDLM